MAEPATACAVCLRKSKPEPATACAVCLRKSKPDHDQWECSHIECPNRRRVTAAPNDQPPRKDPQHES